MRAVDTNILVRFLTADDPAQFEAAQREIARGDIFVATTVVLETAWVLRRAYSFDQGRVVASLRALAGIPDISLEDASGLAQALDLASGGMDLADALHLATARDCDVFLSFDRDLARHAAKPGAIPVQAPNL